MTLLKAEHVYGTDKREKTCLVLKSKLHWDTQRHPGTFQAYKCCQGTAVTFGLQRFQLMVTVCGKKADPAIAVGPDWNFGCPLGGQPPYQ